LTGTHVEEFVAAGTRAFGRRAGRLPMIRRWLGRLRARSAPRYADDPQRWITLRDFDGNLRIRIDRSAYLGSGIYWMGFNSHTELVVCERLLRPDSVFIDVGANQGEFTLFAAKRVPRGRVVACEPMPQLYEQLRGNLALNKCANVTALNCGCGDVAGERELYTSRVDALNQSHNEGLASIFASARRDTAVARISVRTLDDIAAELNLERVDLIKVDVEGAEFQVVRGAAQLIERHKPALVLEVSESAFAAAGYTKSEFYGYLRARGYELFIIRRFGKLVPIPPAGEPPYCNILCRPRRR
jgi:FkbM family methyltransferase